MASGRRGALPRTPVIDRPRLIDRLAARHEVRLTTIVGGAGSGKTTLLGQLLDVEGDDVDVWCPCSSADRDTPRLLTRLLDATCDALDDYRVPSPERPIVELSERILAAAPSHVCLVIDDVHLVGDTDVFDDLVRELPTNGHLLLAGRTRPPVNPTRLHVRGEVVEIGQRDLLLDEDELIEFANRRGVDVDRLAGAERWPAFAELAVTGTAATSQRFLQDEVVAPLDPDTRRALAAFAVVDGGDQTLARAVTGRNLDELVDGLPLVRWDGDDARLHDLWLEFLADELDDDEVRDAAHTAARVHLDRRDLDRAIVLGSRHRHWDVVNAALLAAIRGGADGGLHAGALEQWLTLMSPELVSSPTGLLAQAIIERDRDPASGDARRLFERAADGFAAEGQVGNELLAVLQLVFIARFAGEAEVLISANERIAELADRHPPARPYTQFTEALNAIAQGRPDLQLAALDRLLHVELPPQWVAARDNLRAHALYLLGRPAEALRATPPPDAVAGLTFPGAAVTESQALWFAGHPEQALDLRDTIVTADVNARDGFKGHAWIAVMAAWVGWADVAADHVARARRLAGEVPPAVGMGQLFGVEILLQLARGDDEDAAAATSGLLELAPLGQGVSEQNLRPVLALPYVLAPSTNEYWESIELGPAQLVSLELARALVAARGGDDRRLRDLEWPAPGVIAANLPVRWAIEFGIRGAGAGRHEGHQLVRWLCEQWGASARSALLALHDDPELGTVAAELGSRTPIPPHHEVAVNVLGASRLLIDGVDTVDQHWRRERVRALLAWLIVRRHGTREQIAGALWPDITPERAGKNLRTTLNYLHGLLEPGRRSGDATWFVEVDAQRISLRSDLPVDLDRFHELLDAAEAAEKSGRSSQALPLLLEAAELYGGDLASDLDASWLDLERLHVRSRSTRAMARAAELLTSSGRAAEAIDVCHRALRVDPFHERVLDSLVDAYVAVGDPHAADEVRRRSWLSDD